MRQLSGHRDIQDIATHLKIGHLHWNLRVHDLQMTYRNGARVVFPVMAARVTFPFRPSIIHVCEFYIQSPDEFPLKLFWIHVCDGVYFFKQRLFLSSYKSVANSRFKRVELFSAWSIKLFLYKPYIFRCREHMKLPIIIALPNSETKPLKKPTSIFQHISATHKAYNIHVLSYL